MEDATQPKCLCPIEDQGTELRKKEEFLTVAEAAAVASGYSPCCIYWRDSPDLEPSLCMEMDLWEQELHRAVACGRLPSRRNRSDSKARLVSRLALEEWLTNHKPRASSKEAGNATQEPLLTQRANAILKAIKKKGFDEKAITTPQKTLLRKVVKTEFPRLYFTKSTFNKAWIEGGKRGLFQIRDKHKFVRTHTLKKGGAKKV